MPTFFFIFLLLLLPLPWPTAAVLDPRDYLALQSLRSSLRDLPGSAFFSSWDFTGDPCSSFSGVLCSGDRVVSLSLGSSAAGVPGLSGLLPSSLSRLSSLSHLSLVPGRVYGPIPDLGSLADLRFLALSGNFLSGRIPPSISSLRRLQTLDLSYNLLSGPVPKIPNSVVNLILNHNHLTGGIPDLSALTSLVRLDLKRNNLSGKLPALPHSVENLSASYNRLSGRVDQVVGKLTNLVLLDLSVNRLSGQIPGAIFSFSAIKTVSLQRNRFTGPVRVSGMTKARTVDLSYNGLSGAVPEGLAGAERVYLNSNRFEGRLPARFGERVRRGEIEVLYLQRNFLTGVDGLGPGPVPGSVTMCLNFNCMVPVAGSVCPVRGGRWKRRPAAECKKWKGRNTDPLH